MDSGLNDLENAAHGLGVDRWARADVRVGEAQMRGVCRGIESAAVGVSGAVASGPCLHQMIK